MKIGIHVRTDSHLGHVSGIVHAAMDRGHEVAIFVMSAGARLLESAALAELAALPAVHITFCSHNAKAWGVLTDMLPSALIAGSQYDNERMVNNADRVITL